MKKQDFTYKDIDMLFNESKDHFYDLDSDSFHFVMQDQSIVIVPEYDVTGYLVAYPHIED